ncbi:hypothetical protein, partial [Sinorhizobium sp. CCBAU 05631]|uniref:hypothetical protein n=1 Tax=Sinorhizobium sp. CCBAU 05631 TaxID=794846 RepID=UPI0005689B18
GFRVGRHDGSLEDGGQKGARLDRCHESVRDLEVKDEHTLDAALRRRNDFCADSAMICAVANR